MMGRRVLCHVTELKWMTTVWRYEDHWECLRIIGIKGGARSSRCSRISNGEGDVLRTLYMNRLVVSDENEL